MIQKTVLELNQEEVGMKLNSLYTTALELSQLVKRGPKFDAVWPPISVEINCDSVEKMIHPKLYDFVCLDVGDV